MNKEQPFTPKYWVVHDVENDDVLLHTASKSRDHSILTYCNQFEPDELGNPVLEHFYDNENLQCDIIEVRLYETE